MIYIFPYISDGPLWNDKVTREIGHCKVSWWTSLLAISNIVHTEDQVRIVYTYSYFIELEHPLSNESIFELLIHFILCLQCLVVSWYMSADMQIAFVGFGLLYVTTKSRVWGWIFIILTYLLGAFVTFAVAYANKFHGVLPVYVR